MDHQQMQDALEVQEQRPFDRQAAERAIGAGLLRWASWCTAVGRGEGAAGVVRGDTASGHASRRAEFDSLGIQGHGQLWSLVETVVVARLSQANEHAHAMGTLFFHDGMSSSIRALLRVHSEACARGLWVAAPDIDARTALQRAIGELAAETNAMPAPDRRRLHDQVVRPLAEAAELDLEEGRGGRWHASKKVRPDAREVVQLSGTLGPSSNDWLGHSYERHSAAIHSSILSWATSLLDDYDASRKVLALDLLHSASAHHLLQSLQEGWHEWQPPDLMEHGRRASMSNLTLALLRISWPTSHEHRRGGPP
jgi:hypothetical protein